MKKQITSNLEIKLPTSNVCKLMTDCYKTVRETIHHMR